MNLAFFIFLAIPPHAGTTPCQDSFVSPCKRDRLVLQWVCLFPPFPSYLAIPTASSHPHGGSLFLQKLAIPGAGRCVLSWQAYTMAVGIGMLGQDV